MPETNDAPHDRRKSHVDLSSRLRKAIANHDLTLLYQPIHDIHSGQVRSTEALMRWTRKSQEHTPIEALADAAERGDASALNGVNALERARCAIDRTQQFSDWWIEPIDFFRLRYVTLSYRLPPQWLRGIQNATLTLAGRNLFYNSDYSGLDPESADQSDSQVGRREYYVLPQLRSFTLAFRVGW